MIFDPAILFGGMVFSGIGFIAFRYGKTNGNFSLMAVGGALMAYSYFTPTVLLTYGVGVALTAVAWYCRE